MLGTVVTSPAGPGGAWDIFGDRGKAVFLTRHPGPLFLRFEQSRAAGLRRPHVGGQSRQRGEAGAKDRERPRQGEGQVPGELKEPEAILHPRNSC